MKARLSAMIRRRGAPAWRAFEQAARDPSGTQSRLLHAILRINRDTVYGREHGFGRLRNAAAFAAAVPVITYNDMASCVERMTTGEPGVLTREPPIRFNTTSGTTAKPKLIPVTQRGANAVARVSLLTLSRALRDHPGILDGDLLLALGPSVESHTPSGVPCGSASGMIRDGLPACLRRSFVPPPAITSVGNYNLRYYLAARFALARSVSLIVTPNPTTLLRIHETAMRHAAELIRAIHDGVLFHACPYDAPGGDLPLLAKLGGALKPDPARARQLEAVALRHGCLLPRACWPHVRLIQCWLGGTIGIQADKLVPLYGDATPRRDLGYLASEASMTVPLADASAAGVLALHANYYEFFPDEAEDRPAPGDLLTCAELREGRPYRVVLTNWNGLYRYDIGDVVEVQGFYRRTPVVTFVRKSGDMLNLTGEKLHVNHLLAAFRRLKQRLNVTVAPFRAIADPVKVRYELLLRLTPEPTSHALRTLVLPLLDECLCRVNPEYREKRHSGRLKPPVLHVMDSRWEDAVRGAALADGRTDLQFKWRPMAAGLSPLDARHIARTLEPRGAS